MSKTERFTLEEKKQIAAEYADKSIKARDIANKWALAGGMLKDIITEMGGEMRNPNACHPKGKNSKNKVCPKCHKKIELKGAKFCPYCGSDIRSEKELLIERAQRIFPLLVHLPSPEDETVRATIHDLIDYISKEDK